MSQTLYRKYRPMTFSQVVGQEHVVRTLMGALATGRIGHAFLFTGPRGTGKTTLARIFAKALNCGKKKDGEPCNQCDACTGANQGNFLDVIEIDAASNRGIEEIRNLKDSAQVASMAGGYKIFVVDECLTGEHLITMGDGSVKQISEIKNGDLVNSIDLRSGKLMSKPVSNFFKRYSKKLIKIRSAQGIIRCTPTHKLWALRNGTFTLTEAQFIEKTDYMISPFAIPHISQNSLSPEQLSLIALIQCDGHVSKDSNVIQVDIKKDVNYFITKIKKGLNAWNIKEKPVVRKTKRGTTLIRIYSKELKNILLKLNCPSGKKSGVIDIHDQIFQAPLPSIKSYIDTCFCCEGDASWTPSTRLFKLCFNSVSKSFAVKLQLLLKKFGVATSLMEIKRKNKDYGTVYRINITGYDLRLFQKLIGLSIRRKARVLRAQNNHKIKTDSMPFQSILLQLHKELGIPHRILNQHGIFLGINQNLTRTSFESFITLSRVEELKKYLEFRYEKILNIEEESSGDWVYDFTVDGTHTFLANGLCSSNCHMLTKDAFNALLKILEEPPAHVVFMLATTEPHKIIPTVLSRVQRFDLKRLTPAQIFQKLTSIVKAEKIDIEDGALKAIASSSDGALRDAEVSLAKVRSVAGTNNITAEIATEALGLIPANYHPEFLGYLASADKAAALGLIQRMHDSGVDLENFAKDFLEYSRRVLMAQINPTVLISVGEELPELHQVDGKRFIKLIQLFTSARNEMKSSPIIQLPLELAVLEFLE